MDYNSHIRKITSEEIFGWGNRITAACTGFRPIHESDALIDAVHQEWVERDLTDDDVTIIDIARVVRSGRQAFVYVTTTRLMARIIEFTKEHGWHVGNKLADVADCVGFSRPRRGQYLFRPIYISQELVR